MLHKYYIVMDYDDVAPRRDWLLSELSEKQRRQVSSERAIAFVAREVGAGVGRGGGLHEIGRIMGFSACKLTQYHGSCPHSVKKSHFHVL